MITEIQGLPPIVIQDFPELQNNVKREMQVSMQSSKELSENTDNQSDKVLTKDLQQTKKMTDFSELSGKAMKIVDDSSLIVEFSIDDATKKLILKLINNETDEVVQQYPPEIALKIARIIADTLETGNVTNARV